MNYEQQNFFVFISDFKYFLKVFNCPPVDNWHYKKFTLNTKIRRKKKIMRYSGSLKTVENTEGL